MQSADLFPESLLVTREGGRIYTTSRKVAEHFHKRHDNVLRDTERVQADVVLLGHSPLNFEERIHRYTTGKGQAREARIYAMDRKAFAILAGRFTGRHALRWQMDFYDAFESMETGLTDMQARYVAALDIIRPKLRPVVNDFADGMTRGDTAMWLGCSVNSVSYQRGQARRLGLLPSMAQGMARGAPHRIVDCDTGLELVNEGGAA